MRSFVLLVVLALTAACATTKPAAAPAPARSSHPEVVACEAGELIRCFDAIQVLRADAALEREARARWGEGCERDNAEDCFRLGLLVRLAESFAPLKRACSLDLMEGCFMLAGQFEAIEEHNQDPRASAAVETLYRKSCDGDFAPGCLSLATRLERTDEAAALVVLDRACALDEPIGCERAKRHRCARGSASDCAPAAPAAAPAR